MPVQCLSLTDIGYAQGMNDLLARFLVVTNSEVDSYWMFARYMEVKRGDFLEHTMMKKVGECMCVCVCVCGIWEREYRPPIYYL